MNTTERVKSEEIQKYPKRVKILNWENQKRTFVPRELKRKINPFELKVFYFDGNWKCQKETKFFKWSRPKKLNSVRLLPRKYQSPELWNPNFLPHILPIETIYFTQKFTLNLVRPRTDLNAQIPLEIWTGKGFISYHGNYRRVSEYSNTNNILHFWPIYLFRTETFSSCFWSKSGQKMQYIIVIRIIGHPAIVWIIGYERSCVVK